MTMVTNIKKITGTQFFDELSENIKFPSRSDYTIYHFYQGGKVLGSSSDRTDPAFPSDALIEKVFNKESFNEARDGIRKSLSQLDELFAEWLFFILDIEENPKRQMLLTKAREKSAPSSYQSIYEEARDLVDLIR